jgi:hypothetical protein
MTYLFQAIPSPYGLPSFETMPFLLSDDSTNDGVTPFVPVEAPVAASPDKVVDSNSIDNIAKLFHAVTTTEGYDALPVDTTIDLST